ncbi:MAG: chromate transporter [Burkholderiaceae bacterium]|nr:chromate transporter [Burkholderiaceae bacterium]
MTRRELFLCFFVMGLVAFGGVLPWARRALVEQRRWLSAEEFAEALSLGQVLPGPNVVNLAVMVGARFHGALGAMLAFTGLMLAPLAIILLLAVLYGHYGQLGVVQHAIRGTAAAAAGLVVAMGYNMVRRQAQKQAHAWRKSGVTAAAFAGSGLLALPLLWVLAVLAPVSMLLAWRGHK